MSKTGASGGIVLADATEPLIIKFSAWDWDLVGYPEKIGEKYWVVGDLDHRTPPDYPITSPQLFGAPPSSTPVACISSDTKELEWETCAVCQAGTKCENQVLQLDAGGNQRNNGDFQLTVSFESTNGSNVAGTVATLGEVKVDCSDFGLGATEFGLGAIIELRWVQDGCASEKERVKYKCVTTMYDYITPKLYTRCGPGTAGLDGLSTHDVTCPAGMAMSSFTVVSTGCTTTGHVRFEYECIGWPPAMSPPGAPPLPPAPPISPPPFAPGSWVTFSGPNRLYCGDDQSDPSQNGVWLKYNYEYAVATYYRNTDMTIEDCTNMLDQHGVTTNKDYKWISYIHNTDQASDLLAGNCLVTTHCDQGSWKYDSNPNADYVEIRTFCSGAEGACPPPGGLPNVMGSNNMG